MGNDISRFIEQTQKASEDGKPVSIALAHLKKKVKGSHVKLVAAKIPNVTSISLVSCSLKAIPSELKNSTTKWDIKHLILTNNLIKALPKGLNEMLPSEYTCERAPIIMPFSLMHKTLQQPRIHTCYTFVI